MLALVQVAESTWNRHAAHQENVAEKIGMAITKQQVVQNLHKLNIYGAQMLPNILKKFVFFVSHHSIALQFHEGHARLNCHPQKKAHSFPSSNF